MISTHRTGSFSQTSQLFGHPASDPASGEKAGLGLLGIPASDEKAWACKSNIYFLYLAYLPQKYIDELRTEQALSKIGK